MGVRMIPTSLRLIWGCRETTYDQYLAGCLTQKSSLNFSYGSYLFVSVEVTLQKEFPLYKCVLSQFSSVTQSCPTLWPHEPQYASPLCPLPTPGVYPNSWPLSRWWHPTISSSGIPFSFCPQSFPSLGLFKWFSSSHQVAKVLEFQLQHQSFQWTLRTDL